MNTPKSDNVIVNTNLPHINVQNYSSFNTLLLWKSIIYRVKCYYQWLKIDEKNISEEISSHQNPVEIIDHKCDDNGSNLPNTEEEVDFTLIHSINTTNYISMNDDDNFIHNYYAPFFFKEPWRCIFYIRIWFRETNSSSS